MLYNVSASNARKAAPADFDPYKAFLIINTVTASELVHIFSRQSAFKSQAMMLRAFNAAILSAMCMESRKTTDAYVNVDGTSVVCLPPATNCALRRKFSPILTSNIWGGNVLHGVRNFIHRFSPCSKGWLHILHLFGNLDSKLMRSNPIFRFNLRDYLVPFLNGIWDPPRKLVC